MTWPFDPLTPMKYGAILADPPWAYAMRSDKGYDKSPEAHKAWSAIHRASPGPERWKIRSKTFEGMAEAWADQWGGYAMEAAA